MAIEVLLMSDVKDLGTAGDVVTVKDGYARNFLLPHKLAEPVTKSALRKLDKLRKEREDLSRIRRAESMTKASQLNGKSITIRAKTTDGTRLYGSVSAGDVVAALAAEGIAVDKSQIALTDHIKETGTFDVTVNLFTDIDAVIKVWIVEG